MSRSASSANPPTLACWILESIVPSSAPSAIVGDLVEEYAHRAANDSFGAALWFWSQTVRSVPHLLVSAARTEWLLNLRVALITYVVVEAFKIGTTALLSQWVTRPLTWILLSPVTFVILNAAGGLVIARVRRAAGVALSAMVMLTVAVMSLGGFCSIPVPWWYQFGFFALAPVTVLIPSALHTPRIGASS